MPRTSIRSNICGRGSSDMGWPTTVLTISASCSSPRGANLRALKSDPRSLRLAGCRLRSGNVVIYGGLNNSDVAVEKGHISYPRRWQLVFCLFAPRPSPARYATESATVVRDYQVARLFADRPASTCYRWPGRYSHKDNRSRNLSAQQQNFRNSRAQAA